MKWFRMMIVFAVALVSCSFASAQTPTPVPDPGPGTVQPDPCMVLQQQINLCSAQCTAWDAIIQQKTAQIAAAQTALNDWQNALNLFLKGVAEQEGPMTPGQSQTLAALTAAIDGANAFIRTTSDELREAQRQLALWKQGLQQAQQDFNAAGC